MDGLAHPLLLPPCHPLLTFFCLLTSSCPQCSALCCSQNYLESLTLTFNLLNYQQFNNVTFINSKISKIF